MQQTLTLLAGDSKERENKGGGWKTKERGKKGGEVAPHLLTSHETDGDNLCRFFPFFFFCHQLPFAVFCLFCFTYLTVIAPRCPVILAQWALRQTKSLHVHSTRGLRLNSNLFFFYLFLITCPEKQVRPRVSEMLFVVRRHIRQLRSNLSSPLLEGKLMSRLLGDCCYTTTEFTQFSCKYKFSSNCSRCTTLCLRCSLGASLMLKNHGKQEGKCETQLHSV